MDSIVLLDPIMERRDYACHQMIRNGIVAKGFIPIMLDNGSEALRNHQVPKPRMIFLGCWLKDMDVENFLRELKEIDPEASIVMLYSSSAENKAKNLMEKFGIRHAISKNTLSERIVVRMIQEVLNKKVPA